MEVAVCGSSSVWDFGVIVEGCESFGVWGRSVWSFFDFEGLLSVGLVLCRVAMCASCNLRGLQCLAIAMYGNCNIKGLRHVGLVEGRSCGLWEFVFVKVPMFQVRHV